ncbi:MAG: OmpP1/FadL family transporter [bacterium]
MKRLIIVITSILSTQLSSAQEPIDALRYSMMGHGGTARARAIGGALTSLGGDFSSVAVNPAGLALFKTSELVFTPSFSFNNTKTNYLTNEVKDKKTNPDFSNIGLIIPRPGSWNGKWKNFTWAVGMNKTINFGNSVSLKGNNNQSSYSEKYLEELINNNVTDPNAAASDYPFGSSLAFNTFLIDTISGPNSTIEGYKSQATVSSGLTQEQTITSKGSINDMYVATSANYMDKIYFGGSVNFSRLRYEKTSVYKESDASNNPNNNFNYFETEDYLLTDGVGIGVKLGVIVKPIDRIRIGIAYHSPVLFNMEDFYSTKVTTDLEGYQGNGILTQSSKDFNEGQLGNFEYNFRNPMRLLFGLSYVLREVQDVTRQKGFISADVEYLNYGKATFKAGGNTQDHSSYLNEVNNAISNQFKSAINLRIGGELKFNTIMARLGFNYMGNAYAEKPLVARQMNISGGLGYRHMGFFVDLTYVHQLAKNATFPYRLDNGFFAPGYIRGSNGNIILSIGFKF